MNTDTTTTDKASTLLWSASVPLRLLKRSLPLLKPAHSDAPMLNSVLISADPRNVHSLSFETLVGPHSIADGLSRVRVNCTVQVHSSVDYAHIEQQRYVMPYDSFQALAKLKGKDDSNVQLSAHSNNVIEATFGKTTTSIKLLDSNDYPIMPDSICKSMAAPVDTVGINTHWITMLRDCTSKDRHRPSLHAIMCNGKEYVATDGYNLLRLPRKEPIDMEPILLRIPDKQKLIGEGTYFIDHKWGKWNGMYCNDRGLIHELFLSTVDEKYPDYENVIPKGPLHTVTISQAMALKLNETIKHIHKTRKAPKGDFNPSIILMFNESCITLSYEDDYTSISESFAISSPVSALDSAPLRVGFNPEYLAKALHPLTHSEKDNSEVHIELFGSLRAVIFYDDQRANSSLVMPVRLG